MPQTEPQPGARSRFESMGRAMDEQFQQAAPRAEEEIRKVIDYLNDEVVPQVRRNSSEALRFASEHLNKLAEHLERATRPKP